MILRVVAIGFDTLQILRDTLSFGAVHRSRISLAGKMGENSPVPPTRWAPIGHKWSDMASPLEIGRKQMGNWC